MKIVDRELTPADGKTGLYYDYFRNLAGTVQHVYEDKSVCVQVEIESLPEDVRKRHLEVQEAVKRRWLESISQEQREKLSEKERQVTLAYNILVDSRDLEILAKAKGKPAAWLKAQGSAEPAAAAGPRRSARPAPETSKPEPKPPPKARASAKEQPAQRPTQADIERAEAEHLKAVAAKAKRGKS